MLEIQPLKILSVTSEDYSYPARNLLTGSSSFQWCCKNPGENEVCVKFQFRDLIKFTRIELGNNSSAFIEVQVSKFYSQNNYQVLLGCTALMTPAEAMKCENMKRVRYFKDINFSRASLDNWDIVKIICTQPFNKILQYGLSFIRFFGETNSVTISDNTVNVPDEKIVDITKILRLDYEVSDNWQPGNLFTMKNSLGISSCSIPSREKIIDMTKNTDFHSEETLNNSLTNHLTSSNTSVTKALEVPSENSDTKLIPKPIVKRKHEKADHNDNSDIVCSPKVRKSRNEVDSNDRIKSCEKKVRVTDESRTKKPESKVHSKSLKTDTLINQPQISADVASTSAGDQLTKTNILSGVVFVLSGYQNPTRNSIRDKALSLGAEYQASWTDNCTHLICAFSNTPKFREVSGKGIIVSENWIFDCYNRKQMLPWRHYRLKGAVSPDKSVTVCQPGRSCTSQSKTEQVTLQKQSSSHDPESVPVYNDSLIQIPSVLGSEHIFLHSCLGNDELRFQTRWIETFGGTLHRFMNPNVSIIITNMNWNRDFDEALLSNDRLRFVRPEWLHRCDELGYLMPLNNFEIHK